MSTANSKDITLEDLGDGFFLWKECLEARANPSEKLGGELYSLLKEGDLKSIKAHRSDSPDAYRKVYYNLRNLLTQSEEAIKSGANVDSLLEDANRQIGELIVMGFYEDDDDDFI